MARFVVSDDKKAKYCHEHGIYHKPAIANNSDLGRSEHIPRKKAEQITTRSKECGHSEAKKAYHLR